MRFSGKMCFKIILKVTKNQDFTLSLGDTFFEKPLGILGLKYLSNFWQILEMRLINCEINFILTWSANCFTTANAIDG